jgi:flagellin-like protein
MRKGVTPVVAVVLLIAVSVAASATVYEVFSATQSQAEQIQPDLDLSTNSLSVESCWGTPTDFNISVRSTASEAINASKIPVNLNTTDLSQPDDYTISDPIVDSQETFIIDFTTSQPIDEATRIRLITTAETVEYQCLNLN